MIEFSGKIENEIQAKIITERGQFVSVIGIIIGVAGLIGCLIVWLIKGNLDAEMMEILILSIVVVLIYLIIAVPTNSKRLRFEWDYNIKIENELITVVFNHQNGAVKKYKMSKIKKVVDYGKYYYLFVGRIDPSNGIVCQKDLLIGGTVEDFEKLFEGKLKRKVNKK